MSAQHYDDTDVPAVTFDHNDDTLVVIIGSGAGGGTLADELTRKGINVVVLEAGPRFTEDDFVNDEWVMTDRLTWADKRIASGTSGLARAFPNSPTWVCKGVGGTTLHWAAMCPRFKPYEFKTRTTYGAIDGANIADWPIGFEDIEPFYERAEQKMGVTGRSGIPFHRLGYTNIDTQHLAINAKPRDGRNACDHIGFCMQGCKSGAKWSTFNSEIPRAEATGRCEIRTHCMVLRIEHGSDGRVTEVLYVDGTGTQHRQRARLVCVAANSVETTRLLLNSESARHPHGLANGSGLVGKHYMKHNTCYMFATFDQPVNMHRGVAAAGVIRDESRDDDSRGFVGGFYIGSLGLGLPYLAGFLDPAAWGRSYADILEQYDHIAGIHIMGEDLAQETNRVTLDSNERDQYGLAIPHLHLDDHPNEIRMKEFAAAKTTALFEAAGAKQIYTTPPMPASHNLGTCRMSARPDDGVVDKWGRSHEVPNLFISDGSQFTSVMSGNPTLTIVALGIRQAGYIAEQMRTNQL
jgi:choline dehydrogenase-like flavoprotein